MGINRTKSRTPPSTTFALQAWSRVAHLSFHATLWFCSVVFVLNCVVLIVARQVSRPKVKKKRAKKEESESASVGKSKERPLFQSTLASAGSWTAGWEKWNLGRWPPGLQYKVRLLLLNS